MKNYNTWKTANPHYEYQPHVYCADCNVDLEDFDDEDVLDVGTDGEQLCPKCRDSFLNEHCHQCMTPYQSTGDLFLFVCPDCKITYDKDVKF